MLCSYELHHTHGHDVNFRRVGWSSQSTVMMAPTRPPRERFQLAIRTSSSALRCCLLLWPWSKLCSAKNQAYLTIQYPCVHQLWALSKVILKTWHISFQVRFPNICLPNWVSCWRKIIWWSYYAVHLFHPQVESLRCDQSPEPTQNFWVYSEFLSFLFYIADFWRTFWVIWENGSNQIKFEAENEIFCTWKVEKPQCTTSTP